MKDRYTSLRILNPLNTTDRLSLHKLEGISNINDGGKYVRFIIINPGIVNAIIIIHFVI